MGRKVAVVVGLVVAGCVLMPACAKKHSPQDSTETGNPPVIDADRVALVVQDDEVHVVGEKGAVDPGSATIQVTNLVSDKSASGRADANGSFDLKAPGDVNDGFSVQASNGDGDSKTVFVTQGGAAAADGTDGTLSCAQQTRLAAQQLSAVVDSTDDTCTQASDCLAVGVGPVCTDGCSVGFVSKASMAQVEDAVSALEHGLCADFKKQGCSDIVAHCDGVPDPMCLNGHCRLHTAPAGTGDAGSATSDAGDAGSSCTDRYNQASLQLSRAIKSADKTCASSADCVLAPASTDCNGGCDHEVVSVAGRAEVQTALDAINAGLCAGYRNDGCPYGQPMCMQAPTPICKDGQCVGEAAICEQAANQAQAQFDQASASIERTCTQNIDCMYVPLPNCVNSTCALTVVSMVSADQVQAIIDQINQDVCAAAEAAGCTQEPTGPACSPPAPQCIDSKCQ